MGSRASSIRELLEYTGKVASERTSIISIVLIGVVGAFILRTIIYRIKLAYWTPLRHVPGPWYAKFTPLGLNFSDFRGRRWYWVQGLHKKYGSVVRVAPEEVAINDPKEVRRLHAFGTDFRKRRQPGTADNIFSMADAKMHRIRQRFYSGVFSPETLKTTTEPAIRELLDIAVAGIRRDAKESKDHAANMFKWCMLFGNDVAYQVVYGTTNGLMAKRLDVDKVILGAYLQRMISWANVFLPIFLIGRLLSPLSSRLKETFCLHPIYRDLWEEGDRQRAIAAKTVFVQTTKYTRGDGVFRVSDEVSLTDVEIAHDITTFLGAGGEAVGASLTYLVWTVIRKPELQRELEAELAGLEEPIVDSAAAQLPVLNAIIYETLRLYGGGATFLPRYSPSTTEFGGYTIPPGIAVTSHSGALHRNPAAWDDPETFDHRRWLPASQSKALIQDKFQPFSSGARACIATHLVMIEMRLFVAKFFREFAGARLAPSTTDKTMAITDRFHIAPISKHCDVAIPDGKGRGGEKAGEKEGALV